MRALSDRSEVQGWLRRHVLLRAAARESRRVVSSNANGAARSTISGVVQTGAAPATHIEKTNRTIQVAGTPGGAYRIFEGSNGNSGDEEGGRGDFVKTTVTGFCFENNGIRSSA
jgi:hypothetical protein